MSNNDLTRKILDLCNENASMHRGSHDESIQSMSAVLIMMFQKIHRHDKNKRDGHFTNYAEDILSFVRSFEQAALSAQTKEIATQTESQPSTPKSPKPKS
jgi:hypothetical protein